MFDKKKKIEEARKLIKADKDVLFLDDVISSLGMSRPTFYNLFPKGSEEYDELWQLVCENRAKTKKFIRTKLKNNGSATDLILLYKMICTDDERRCVTQTHFDVKGDVDHTINIGLVESAIKPVSSEEEIKDKIR